MPLRPFRLYASIINPLFAAPFGQVCLSDASCPIRIREAISCDESAMELAWQHLHEPPLSFSGDLVHN